MAQGWYRHISLAMLALAVLAVLRGGGHDLDHLLHWSGLLRRPGDGQRRCRSQPSGLLELPAPPLDPVRSQLVPSIEAMEAKLEINRRNNETLEALVWALFKTWFVEFAPVSANAEGRDPGFHNCG